MGGAEYTFQGQVIEKQAEVAKLAKVAEQAVKLDEQLDKALC